MFFIALGLWARPTYAPLGDPCDLPVDLRSVVFRKFPGTSVAHLTDLNEEDRKLYTGDHGAQCLGLASADFYGDGKPTWAMVLISREKLPRKAQLHPRASDRWRLEIRGSEGNRRPHPGGVVRQVRQI